MQTIRELFENHSGRLIHKWDHYLDVYDKHFSRFRNQPVRILEIGIFHGGSLQLWEKYFSEVEIYAIDIHPQCKIFESEKVKVLIGSQDDRKFLTSVKQQIPKVDIIIDDGGHFMQQQIISFEMLYDHVKDGGVYLCEDTQTSYWRAYRGGLRKKKTFIEYSKKLIDQLQAWNIPANKLPVNDFTRSTCSMHFYDGMVIFEKGDHKKPNDRQTGSPFFESTMVRKGKKIIQG